MGNTGGATAQGRTTEKKPHRVGDELAGSGFAASRLQRRFAAVIEQFSARLGASVPWACQDWAAFKAAYRFLGNPRVSEAEILAGHFEATRDRTPAGDSMVRANSCFRRWASGANATLKTLRHRRQQRRFACGFRILSRGLQQLRETQNAASSAPLRGSSRRYGPVPGRRRWGRG